MLSDPIRNSGLPEEIIDHIDTETKGRKSQLIPHYTSSILMTARDALKKKNDDIEFVKHAITAKIAELMEKIGRNRTRGRRR